MLCRAAFQEQYDIVQLLVDFEGDFNATSSVGTMTFFKAAKKNDLNLMRLLLRYDPVSVNLSRKERSLCIVLLREAV